MEQLLAGGPADIFECFDQIVRLILDTLKEAGMANRTREQTITCMNGIGVLNTVAGQIGERHQEPTGIPQENSFSMTPGALVFRGHVFQMRDLKFEARILADDLLVYVEDGDGPQVICEAVQGRDGSCLGR